MTCLKPIDRRQFVKTAAAVALGGQALLSAAESAPSGAPRGKSRVVLVRDPDLLDASGRPRAEVVQAMLDKGVTALTGRTDAAAAWKSLIRPTDRVGIKTNVWRFLPTTAEVENALKRRIMEVGVPEADVGIDDRGVLNNPLFQQATALINARPMRSHHWAGVGTLIKNYIMFLPDPSVIHPDSCADLGSVWQLPPVKGKTRLNVLVMFTPQFHGVGPHNFNPKYLWTYNGLLLGVDPVATDSVGLRIIEGIRREYFGEERPLDPPAKHIQVADTKYRLGTADPKKIELIKIGYGQGSFV